MANMKKTKKSKTIKHEISEKGGYSFKAAREVVVEANKKYFNANGRISLSSLVEQLLTEYISK